MYWSICSPILWIVFLFCWCFPLLCKKLYFDVVPFVYFFFCVPHLGDTSNRTWLWAMSEILLPVFSSMIFMVSGLTFKSLIHFEFILVCSLRRGSSFTFLHIFVQFSQHHSLSKLTLAHYMCLLPLSNFN